MIWCPAWSHSTEWHPFRPCLPLLYTMANWASGLCPGFVLSSCLQLGSPRSWGTGPPPGLKAEVVSVPRLPVPEKRVRLSDPPPAPWCLAQAAPLVRTVGQTVPSHRFLSMLEEEIYGANSPIWESGFTMPPSEGTQLVPRPGMCHSRFYKISAWPSWLSSGDPAPRCGRGASNSRREKCRRAPLEVGGSRSLFRAHQHLWNPRPRFSCLSQLQSVQPLFPAPPSSAPPWVGAAIAP